MPTADVEALSLICSMAACEKLRIKSADIKNTYFNADPVDRLLLLKPPKGGLPGVSTVERVAIVANKHIYGTPDAGRGFFKKGKNQIVHPPQKAARQHTVREVHMDNWGNFTCYNRRRVFVGYVA